MEQHIQQTGYVNRESNHGNKAIGNQMEHHLQQTGYVNTK